MEHGTVVTVPEILRIWTLHMSKRQS